MESAPIIRDCLGRERVPQCFPDGSWNCPFCMAAVLAGTIEHAERRCPNPACFARGDFPIARAEEILASEVRARAEVIARQEQHATRMTELTRQASARAETYAEIRAACAVSGACPRCALHSIRYGGKVKFTKHRVACPLDSRLGVVSLGVVDSNGYTWQEAAHWLESLNFHVSVKSGPKWYWYGEEEHGPSIRVRLWTANPWMVSVMGPPPSPRAFDRARLVLWNRTSTKEPGDYSELQTAVQQAMVKYDEVVSRLSGLSMNLGATEEEDWRQPAPVILNWDTLRTWLNSNLKWNRGDVHYAGRGWWFPGAPSFGARGSGDLLPGDLLPEAASTLDRSRNYISVEEDRANPAMFVSWNFDGVSGTSYHENPAGVKAAVESLLMKWDEEGLSGAGRFFTSTRPHRVGKKVLVTSFEPPITGRIYAAVKDWLIVKRDSDGHLFTIRNADAVEVEETARADETLNGVQPRCPRGSRRRTHGKCVRG